MTDTPQTTDLPARGMNARETVAWLEGVGACVRGKNLDANPHHHATSIQSANFRAWELGWKHQAKVDGKVLND